MEQFLRKMRGYVRIRLESRMPERFLKMCAHHDIALRHIIHRDGCYEMELGVQDFFRLKPLCRKSGSRIHILQKKGLPFFFYKNKKRKAFFVGIFCCIFLLVLCSTRIWNIHVEGNYSYSSQSVLAYLRSARIEHGIAKRNVNCGRIAAALREHFPDITWVSAKIRGTRLLITIQESADRQTEDSPDGDAPCDLLAGDDGTIVRMITRRGAPVMAEGQSCRKGDVLISGRLEILNDNGEVIRHEYVEADGDVSIRRVIDYSDEFPMEYERRSYTGRSHRSADIQMGRYLLNVGLPHRAFRLCDRVSAFKQVRLTESFYLPLQFGMTREREYQVQVRRHTDNEAEKIAEQKLWNFLDDLSEKGMKILRNDVKISVNGQSCVSRGTITIVESTGVKVPVEVMQDPPASQERIPINEQ